MDKIITSPFHQGEQKIQQRLGVRDKMERFGRQVIRDFMPDQHQQFYARLPFVFVAHADQQGWPWASILFNQPGFIKAVDNKHLQINTSPVVGDPLNDAMAQDDKWGLLGIELETRRRNRLAAHINHISDKGVELIIDQAFGNCPQYIQKRQLHSIDPLSMPAAEVIDLTQFDQSAIELIRNSDTFFVASFIANGTDAISEGADVSHRGGKPGFIRVDDAYSLTIPDYLGNFHFNTLGNFLENPKAGLLFIDFTQGHLLTLTGTVEILWDSPDTEFFAGAERLWTFHIDHGRWLKNVLPLRWDLQEISPNTSLTGSWREAEAAQKADLLSNTWQPYRIRKIVQESSVIKSFYLQAPADQTPQFQVGQFLTLKAAIDGKDQIRTYTLSSAPGDQDFRVSIKLDGIFSSYMHQQIAASDVLLAKAPTGSFTLDMTSHRTAVLICAGIGITPMIAMARHVLQQAVRTRSIRPVIMICSARNNEQRAFYAELNEIAKSSEGHIRIVWALSQPESHLQAGLDYQYHGRISRQILQAELPADDYQVYLCGPNAFMQDQYNSLRELGLDDKHIFAEAFGPSALIRDASSETVIFESLPVAEQAVVRFSESKFEQVWSTGDGSLLEFAEAHGLNPEYGCRSGQCGACKVKLLQGKVSYLNTISTELEQDEILLCCSVPASYPENEVTRLKIQL